MKEKRLFWIFLVAALVLLLGIFAIWRLSSTPAVQAMVKVVPTEQLQNTTGEPTLPSESAESTADITESDPTEDLSPAATDQTEPTDETESTNQPLPSTSTSNAIEPIEPTEPGTDPQQRINELINLAYELRDEYKSRLAQIESDALAQYEALAPDKRTRENKESIIRAAVNEAYALEEECDARITDICTELSYLLLDTHGDMYLVSEIRYAYATEKNNVRNDFLERYSEYLGS